jgi:hypothetical protein
MSIIRKCTWPDKRKKPLKGLKYRLLRLHSVMVVMAVVMMVVVPLNTVCLGAGS